MALQQQQQQSSRLNRLLTLLDTGSTSATRSTAARQIGEIAKQHPGELQPLLRRVRQFLRSKAWETRVAAAKAVGAIAENVQHVSVKDVLDKAIAELQRMGCAVSMEALLSGCTSEQSTSALAFSNFDINRVLEYGGLLLSSGGQEYDVVVDSSKSPAERLARQKQNFRRRLGLDDFVDVNEMIRDDDLMTPRHVQGRQQGRRQEAQRLVANMVPGVLSRQLSARERNKLKRKAKVIVKDGPKEAVDVEEPVAKRAKPVITESSQGDKLVLDSVMEDDGVDASDGRWPFDRFVDLLMHDMFDPVWEIRHGSIMALREILSSHAACAAVADPEAGMVVAAGVPEETSIVVDDKRAESADVEGLDQKPGILKDVVMHDTAETKEDIPLADNGAANAADSRQETEAELLDSQKELDLNQDAFQPAKGSLPPISVNEKAAKVIAGARHAWAANTEFLQDCTLRLICVFALDRFGDFVSDQVVAPVRETCAQVLGAVFKQMPSPLLHETLGILLQMQQCTEWEVRHGSLLGIKYLVAVRREMISEILPRILPACVAGLGDPDDDVRAVAAEALLPASSALVSQAGRALKTILLLLWDILLDLDDLSPSTSSVMHLLAELYSRPEALSTTLRTSGGPGIDLNDEASASEADDQLDLGDPHSLSILAPRLWPFMRHNISSVRLAAIRTLEQLLEAGNSGDTSWTIPILGDALRLVYQNLLMEPDDVILQSSLRVWRVLVERACSELEMSTSGYFSSWLELASTAAGSSLEASSMFSPTSLPKGSRSKAVAKLRAAKGAAFLQIAEPQRTLDVIPKVVVGAEGERSIIHMRASSASALGILAARAPDSMLGVIVQALSNALSSPSGVQRQVAAMVLVTCFKELSLLPQEQKLRVFVAAKPLDSQLQTLLSATDPSQPTPGSALPYAELFRTYSKMRAEASQLLKQAEASGIDTGVASVDGLSVEGAISLAIKLKRDDNNSTEETSSLETIRQPLLATAGYLKCVQTNLHGSILALMASAIVWMGRLPSKLNPIIQPLMISIKREQEELLQQSAAEALAEVIAHCVGRKPCPNDKLIKNLSSMACADTMETPVATDANSACNIEDMELVTSKAASSVKKSDALSAEERAKLLEGSVTRRGAELAIKALCQRFGEQLFEKLPKLWDCLTDVIKPSESQSSCVVLLQADPQALINNLQLVRTISPFLEDRLQSRVLDLLPAVFGGIRHPHAAVRLAASRCIAAMARTTRETVMTAVLSKAMPMLTDASSVEARQGAGMLITFLVDGLGVDLVPYAPVLIVPLLGCMGDSNQVVRQSVTHSFAALVPLLPLARGLPPPPGLPSSKSSEDAKFLEQLLDNSRVDDYKLAFNLSTPLRRYQQEGINWLAFLKRFKLHGILCDDMGLGKTLQASAIVASDTAERAKKGLVQSLIVCPPTLVGHWVYEIEKFIPSDVLKPMQYVGQPHERVYLRNQLSAHNVIITSYDVLRKDVDYLSQILWNFYILDEGHIIKNGKSKVTLAVKRVQAEHRLILSGTPVQNNVLELWSLFDFLMPGFLGTERQFHATYGKPLLAARDGKCSAKEAEAGIFAMEALHKQVMPFLLRRTKDEVLADLPPKIIQDRYCDLSPLQLQLYDKFSGSQAKKDVSKLVEDYGSEDSAAKPSGPKHVFQALQYLRKVCSHPLLVLQSGDITVEKSDLTADLHDIQHSPKLLALRDILEECGIGQANGSEASASTGQHRVLIFAQFKAFLDLIENDLFHTHMKSVTYLRLDGSTELDKRFEIVKAFNSDPTIDVLLLTTQVGGLGLNLTSADTVVFMEHDWNPMRDLQAMDRAHRLGQRRVVNVHRLIMRGTMEEKIMSLQQFKLSVANTVINAENASLNTMDTGQLLDLFTVSGKKATVASSSKSTEKEDVVAEKPKAGGRKGLKSMLSSLEELWDQSLYSEEYNIGQFIDRLK